MSYIYIGASLDAALTPHSVQTNNLLLPFLTSMGFHNSETFQLPCRYTPSSVAAMASLFCGIPELTPELRATAAHAILQSRRSFEDPNTTSKNDGLDWMYLELHGLGKSQGPEAKKIEQFQNKTHKDSLDAVSPSFVDSSDL